jgi:hypothetical protein
VTILRSIGNAEKHDQIFRMQTAPFRAELEDFEFVFVQGYHDMQVEWGNL